MSSEFFRRISPHLDRFKIFEWIKLLRRHLHQIEGKWASRTFNHNNLAWKFTSHYASVNSSCAKPLPRGLLRGICPPCQPLWWGICKFCTARGPGICQQQGHSRAFDTHAVSHQDITTQKALLEKKQIDSSVKDRNKLKRVVRVDFMHAFLHCLSSNNLYIAKTGAIDVNQRFLVIELNFCWYYFKNILSYL